MNARKLARAIVLSDDFRVSHALLDLGANELPGYRKVAPRQLGRMVEDLTGFRWETEIGAFGGGSYDPGKVGRIDLVSDSFFGYGVLFGGTDSYYVTKAAHSMNATSTAVLRNVALKAASHVVANDFKQADASKRRLLRKIAEGESSESAVRAQIATLHARIHGSPVSADSEEVGATYALFRDALSGAKGDVKRAWTLTLYAMFQDVRLAFY
jgi:hypothetical protein